MFTVLPTSTCQRQQLRLRAAQHSVPACGEKKSSAFSWGKDGQECALVGHIDTATCKIDKGDRERTGSRSVVDRVSTNIYLYPTD